MKPVVTLERKLHREKLQLFMSYNGDEPAIERLIRGLPGRKWSQTHRCWYLPYTAASADAIRGKLGAVAELQMAAAAALVDLRAVTEEQIPEAALLGKAKAEAIETLRLFMRSRRYSENTVRAYCEAIAVFMRFVGDKDIQHISEQDVVRFNNEHILKLRLSASYQNQVVNAIKLFYQTVCSRSLQPELIHRPKRAKVLPNVLSKDEVKRLLESQANVKHRAMLGLVYSCGLRCGELLALRFEHLHRSRGTLLVKQSKGRKDRIVPLSKKTIMLLDEYLRCHKPLYFLFEGAKPGEPYDERSLQNVMRQSVERAGILKPATLHWLRHSYATHLLEAGTNLRYIQALLGHASSRTTEVYTHVSTRSIESIISPYDDL